MLTLILTVTVIFVTGYLIKNTRKPSNYPPGPKWYPYLGCIYAVQKLTKQHGSQFKALSYLAKFYSTDVLGLKMGGELVVVVYGEKNIRQVFMEKEFEGRTDSFFIRLRCLGKRLGITFTDGALWKEHRAFTVKHLKNVGFGKTLMEEEIQKEMKRIVEYIKTNNESVNPKKLLASSVINILWKYTAGERINEDRLDLLLQLFSARSKAFSMAGGWLNQAPWIRYIFPQLSGYEIIKTMNEQLCSIIDEAIDKHKKNLVTGSDFIYSFLEEINAKKETYTDEQLRAICLDILIAGSQTTSNILEFALLTVLRRPYLQEKILDEIYSTIGNNTPCWSDNHRLPFTSAFLMEIHRYYSIVPLAGPRRVLENTSIDGFSIPKGTSVLIALGDLHFDKTLWENPNEFDPERFIDSSGGLKNPEHLYPFGLGRRRCPGDSLAKSFIFITFVGIIQNYKITTSNGILPSDEPIVGLISAPRPFKAEFILRQ